MLFDFSSVIMIQRQRNSTKAMTTIERISMTIINFKIFSSRRKYIRVYRYIRTYGSLPLVHKIANKNFLTLSGLDVHHSVPS